MEKLNKILNKVVGFTQTRYMRIITNAFMSTAAVSIAGSIFTLIKSVPIDPWQDFLVSSGLGEILAVPVGITADVISLYIVLGMAYQVAKEFKKDTFSTSVIALGSFLMLIPFNTVIYNADYTVATPVADVLPTSSLGARGVFLAIIVGICAARLYIFFVNKGWTIKLPDTVPEAVSKMFEMMIPGGLTFVAFLLIRFGFTLTPYGDALSLIYKILQAPLVAVGGGLGGLMVYMILSKTLWTLGIHGGMVMYSAMIGVISSVNSANALAFASGAAAPHPIWCYFTMLMDASILPLSLIILIFAKSKQYKLLGKIALPTSLFNISEPLVFGFPLVMNPIMAVPFIGLQVLNPLIVFGALSLGIIAAPTGAAVTNMLPLPIVGSLINANWTGFVLVIVLIAVDMLIWYPFFKFADKRALTLEQEAIEQEEPKTVAEGAGA